MHVGSWSEGPVIPLGLPDREVVDAGDPVSYFTDATPAKGKAAFTATHDGVTYRLASAEHRHQFEAEPAKYLPQYGGYCAMGVAMGKKLAIDPEAYRIVDGKLYLNVNK